jgi:hypothetical protein
MSQLHKHFTVEQVKVLFQNYMADAGSSNSSCINCKSLVHLFMETFILLDQVATLFQYRTVPLLCPIF